VVVLPDGTIVVLVARSDLQTFRTSGSGVVRRDADGTLDRSFGVAGVVKTPFVTAGGRKFAVARYNARSRPLQEELSARCSAGIGRSRVDRPSA
jgi:hypothetical protein